MSTWKDQSEVVDNWSKVQSTMSNPIHVVGGNPIGLLLILTYDKEYYFDRWKGKKNATATYTASTVNTDTWSTNSSKTSKWN